MDVTEAENFINAQRKVGNKITLTHLLAWLIGKTISEEIPEMNCFVRRGNVVKRKTVDANISVLMPNNQMGSVLVKNIDTLNITDVAKIVNQKAIETRKGIEEGANSKKSLLAQIPWPFRKWFYTVIKRLIFDHGLNIPGVGIKDNAFGTFILSNIGTLGLDVGFGALMPGSNLAIALFMGKVESKPVVINDQIVIRRILAIGVTLDHRIIDGQHGGKLFRGVKLRMKNLKNITNY